MTTLKLDRVTTRWMMDRVEKRLRRAPYGRLPSVVVMSLPKSGTHLLKRCLTLLGGHERTDFALISELVDSQDLEDDDARRPTMTWGVGNRCAISQRKIERLLAGLWAGEFAHGHVPYSEDFLRLARRHRVTLLHIVRDPRDAVVSHVHHVVRQATHRLHEHYTRSLRGFDEQLMASIVGVRREEAPGGLPDIGSRLNLILPWLDVTDCYTTRFEDLVGAEGGGSCERQSTEINGIARRLGLALNQAQLKAIAIDLFGKGSKTFRQGRSGAWPDSFGDKHIAAFKQVAAEQLVRLGYEEGLVWSQHRGPSMIDH